MIKINSNSFFIKDINGSLNILNLDELEEDLWNATTGSAASDWEVTKTLLTTLKELIADKYRHGESVSREYVDKLVVRMLNDAGYGHIVSALEAVPAGSVEELQSATPIPEFQRINELISADSFFSGKSTNAIAKLVETKASEWGLQEVTEQFLLELAKILYVNQRREISRHSFAVNEPSEYWLIREKQIYEVFKDEDLEYVRRGIVRISSISRLLPIIKVNIDLEKFVSDFGSDPVLEVQIFPALDSLFQDLESMVDRVKGVVAELTDPPSDYVEQIVFEIDKMHKIMTSDSRGRSNRKAEFTLECQRIMSQYFELNANCRSIFK